MGLPLKVKSVLSLGRNLEKFVYCNTVIPYCCFQTADFYCNDIRGRTLPQTDVKKKTLSESLPAN